MLTVGSVVGGYRIERVLGSGGMGTVYLARSPDLPRSDALKVLSAELSRNPDFRIRFLREADVAASLDHPNIVAIYRRGETEDGQLWIAMQFVAGTDADAALRSGGMTPPRAVYIVGEVGKALDYAHRRNVVHRDVKPANFLLSGEPGPDERVLLGDFGIARALDDVGLTVTGSVMATVAYAAPEVLSGLPFDGRADIYSLGCTLFRMLTGKPPFSGGGMPAVMMAHLHQPPPRVTALVPSLPPQLDWVVSKAMAKDPAARFQSARELTDAAASALRNRTDISMVPTRPVPSHEVVSYPHTPASGPQWWQQNVAPRTLMAPPPVVPPPAKRRQWFWLGGAAAAAVLLVGAMVFAVTALQRSSTDGARSTGPVTTTATTPSPTNVAASELRGLLLGADQVSAIMVGPTLTPTKPRSQMFDDSAHMSDPQCLAAWAPAQLPVYRGTAYTAVESETLRAGATELWQHGVIESVVAFPSDQPAKKFLDDQTNAWRACNGRRFTATPPGAQPQTWTIGNAEVVAGVLSTEIMMEGGESCQRALGARANVAIDVVACKRDVSNIAGTIVTSIAAKIPQP